MQLSSDSTGNRWRKRIADLMVSRGFLAREFPGIRKALEAGDHRCSKAGHSDKITGGRFISNTETINTESSPSFAGASRPKVRASVLFRATHNRRGNFVSLLFPSPCATPALRSHNV